MPYRPALWMTGREPLRRSRSGRVGQGLFGIYLAGDRCPRAPRVLDPEDQADADPATGPLARRGATGGDRAKRVRGTGEDGHARDRICDPRIPYGTQEFFAGTPHWVAHDPRGSGHRPLHWRSCLGPDHRQPDGPRRPPFQRFRPDYGHVSGHRWSRPREPDTRDGDGGGGDKCRSRGWADVDQRWFMPHRDSRSCAASLHGRLHTGARRPPGRQIPPAALHRVRAAHSAVEPVGRWPREHRRHRSHSPPIMRGDRHADADRDAKAATISTGLLGFGFWARTRPARRGDYVIRRGLVLRSTHSTLHSFATRLRRFDVRPDPVEELADLGDQTGRPHP